MTERTMTIVGQSNLISASALTITPTDPTCQEYYVSFDLVSGSPAAGTTAVTAKAYKGGTESVIDLSTGSALNIDPTALKSFTIGQPLDSITFTPSSWTANVVVSVTVCAMTSNTFKIS
jgi:hypothetical protein